MMALGIRLTNTIRPVRPDCIGHGEQWAPVVSNPIDNPGHVGVVVANNISVVLRPTETHTGKIIQLVGSVISQFR
jgi:hypothetical protein